jgi:hypothetical protein
MNDDQPPPQRGLLDEYLWVIIKLIQFLLYVTLPIILADRLMQDTGSALTAMAAAFGVSIAYASSALGLARALDRDADKGRRERLVRSAVDILLGGSLFLASGVIYHSYYDPRSPATRMNWPLIAIVAIAAIGIGLGIFLVMRGWRACTKVMQELVDSRPASRPPAQTIQEP